MGMKSSGGEIVQVEGGHIVRSTGRKDRHSKVFTSKGPRDRRVRLSAHTAIQFYDVQDRLGYDRPSKAVDWLIKKAKAAIDKLAELPPWDPIGDTSAAQERDPDGGSNEMAIPEQSESPGYNYQLHRQLGQNPADSNNPSTFISPQIETHVMADTMKSFFPTSSATSSINFQSYPQDIISRNTNSAQDLGLSLHTFRGPSLIQRQSQGGMDQTPTSDQTLYVGSPAIGFEPINYPEISRGGFVLNQPPIPFSGKSSDFPQRGTLQSSLAPLVRAWDDIPIASSEHHKPSNPPSSIFGSRFVSDGFRIPARIQGDTEEQGVAGTKSSSASLNSHRRLQQ